MWFIASSPVNHNRNQRSSTCFCLDMAWNWLLKVPSTKLWMIHKLKVYVMISSCSMGYFIDYLNYFVKIFKRAICFFVFVFFRFKINSHFWRGWHRWGPGVFIWKIKVKIYKSYVFFPCIKCPFCYIQWYFRVRMSSIILCSKQNTNAFKGLMSVILSLSLQGLSSRTAGAIRRIEETSVGEHEWHGASQSVGAAR